MAIRRAKECWRARRRRSKGITSTRGHERKLLQNETSVCMYLCMFIYFFLAEPVLTSFMKVTDGELKLECEPMEEVSGGVPIRLMGRNATHEIDLRSLRDLHEKKSTALQQKWVQLNPINFCKASTWNVLFSEGPPLWLRGWQSLLECFEKALPTKPSRRLCG